MKKVFRFFLLFIAIFMVNGCSKGNVASNTMSINYKEIRNNKDVIYNLKTGINELNGFKFNMIVNVKNEEYSLSGKVILGETIEKSVINISYGKNNLYFKNGKVYISYYYNNTNVIIKDSLDNYIEEVAASLEKKGIKVNRDDIFDVIKSKSFNDVNFDVLSEYVYSNNGEYGVSYDGCVMLLNNKYLPSSIRYEKSDVEVNVDFNYDKVSIHIPWGYNLFTIDIKDIKELLRVDNISDLIR